MRPFTLVRLNTQLGNPFSSKKLLDILHLHLSWIMLLKGEINRITMKLGRHLTEDWIFRPTVVSRISCTLNIFKSGREEMGALIYHEDIKMNFQEYLWCPIKTFNIDRVG